MSARRRARRVEKGHGIREASPSCPTRKKAYVSRAEAKAVARLMQKKYGGERMSAFACDECAYHHVGHLPRQIKRGEITRGEYYGKDVA